MKRLLPLVALAVLTTRCTHPEAEMPLQQAGPYAPRGLVTSTNLLDNADPGAFTQADNVVMRRPGLVESRRGYELVGTNAPPGVVRNAVNFQGSLVAWGSEGGGWLASYDLQGNTWTQYTGTYAAPDGALEVWLQESEGALFIGAARAAYRLDSVGGQPVLAGAPQGLAGTLAVTGSSGFLPAYAGVAYRVVWGTRTASGRLVLGAPSGRFTVYNIPAPGTDNPPSKNVAVTVPLPAAITSADFFLQVYRSANSEPGTNEDGNPVPGGEPDDEMRLVYEVQVNSSALTSRSITFTDVDVLLNGANLNTNVDTGGGILSGGYPPPVSGVAMAFKGQAFYADLHGVPGLQIEALSVDPGSVFSVGNAISVGDPMHQSSAIEFIGSDHEDASASTTGGIRVSYYHVFSDGSAAQNITNTIQSLVRVINASGYYVRADYLGDGGLTGQGKFILQPLTLPAGVIKVWADRGDSGSTSPALTSTFNWQGFYNSGASTVTLNAPSGFDTSRFVVGQKITIQVYTDLAAHNPIVGGVRTLTAVGASSITYGQSPMSAPGPVAALFSDGSTFTGLTAEDEPAGVAWAPIYQPDTVPLRNYDVVGNSSARVLAMIPLGDYLFLLKEDGLWRVTGFNTGSFNFELFDGTVRFPAPRAVTVLDGKAYALTTAGVVSWDESTRPVPASVQVEQQLRELVTKYPDAVRRLAFMTSYNSEHEMQLWMPESATATSATREWVMNSQGEYTNWLMSATEALVTETGAVPAANDKLYAYNPTPVKWLAERKTLTEADYQDGTNPIGEAITWVPNWGGAPAQGKQWVYWYGLPEHLAPSVCTLGFQTDLWTDRQFADYQRQGNEDPALIDVAVGLHGAALIPHLEHSVAGERLSLKGYSAKVRPYVTGAR